MSERLALLLVANNSTLLVPRRTFADEAVFSRFLDTVASLRRRAPAAPTRHLVTGQQGKVVTGITRMPGRPPDERITR